MRASIGVALLVLALVPGGAAQQPPTLAFHGLAAMPRYPFAGMQARGAMGQTASMLAAGRHTGAVAGSESEGHSRLQCGLGWLAIGTRGAI